MILVVESIEERLVERVNIVESREPINDDFYFLGEGFLGELDLSRVEIYALLT